MALALLVCTCSVTVLHALPHHSATFPAGTRPPAQWRYNAEESQSRSRLEQGWGDLEGLLDRGMQLLRHGRAGAKSEADLGAVDACLQDALACFEAASDIDGSDVRVLVRAGGHCSCDESFQSDGDCLRGAKATCSRTAGDKYCMHGMA